MHVTPIHKYKENLMKIENELKQTSKQTKIPCMGKLYQKQSVNIEIA